MLQKRNLKKLIYVTEKKFKEINLYYKKKI